MKSWRRVIGLGLLTWLVPFLVAFLIFPWRETARPLFESVMAVTVGATAVGVGLVWLRRAADAGARQALVVGIAWLAICLLVDAPLMLLGGPMQMSLGEYLGDIGLTYVTIPVVLWGLGRARSMQAGER